MHHTKLNIALAAIARQNARHFLYKKANHPTVVGKLHTLRLAQTHSNNTLQQQQSLQIKQSKRFNNTASATHNDDYDEVISRVQLGNASGSGIDPSEGYFRRIYEARTEKNLPKIEHEFSSMQTAGVPITADTYNLVLDSYASLRPEGKKLTKILEIYESMKKSGLEPGTRTYIILLNVFCKKEIEVQRMVGILEAMLRREGGDPEIAKKLDELKAENNLGLALETFKSSASKPHVKYDIETCNSLLSVIGPSGRTDDAMFVYEYMQNHGIKPTGATYGSLITVYGHARDLASALECIEEYKNFSFQFEKASVYGSLVNAFICCNNIEGAIDALQRRFPEAGVTPDVRTYTLFIKELCEHGHLATAQEWYTKLKTDKLLPKPSRTLSEVLLFEHSVVGNYAMATEIFNDMLAQKNYPRYTEFSAYLSATAKYDPNNLPNLLSIMYENNQAPDPILTERIITHLIGVSDIGAAVQTLDKSVEHLRNQKKLRPPLIEKYKKITLSLLSDPRLEFKDLTLLLRVWSQHNAFSPQLDGKILEVYDRFKNELGIDQLSLDGTLDVLFRVASSNFIFDKSANRVAEYRSRVLGLLEDGKHHKIYPSKEISKNILRQLTSENKDIAAEWEAATNNLTRWPTELEIKHSQGLYSLCSHVPDIDPDAVVQRVKEMLQQNILATPESMAIAIKNVGKAKFTRHAEELYDIAMDISDRWEQPFKRIAAGHARNSLLISYASVGQIDKALEVYYEILEQGDIPNSDAYASLLVAESGGHFDEAQVAIQMYEELKHFKVRPNLFFYNVLLSKLGKARKFEMVWGIFQEMKEFNVRPNAITYGALITACIRVRSEEQAVALIQEMESSPGFQPRVGPYNSMMQFYTWDMPNREKALQYFEAIKRHNIKPSEHTWKLLIEAYALVEPYDMDAALNVFEEMKQQGAKPVATHYASLIYAYGYRQDDVEKAIATFESMRSKHAIRPDESTYQALFESLVNAQRIDEAEQFYTRMIEQDGLHTTSYIENLFIRNLRC